MKNKIFQLSIFILLILAYIYHRELFITQQKLTLLLMKNITYALKNKKVIYYIFFIFLYGMLHSLAPGHGKSYILNLSLKYSLLKLLIISALIAYGQGLVSYFVATFFIKSISQLQNIDLISKNIYSITLILLASFNLINEFKNKHIENSKWHEYPTGEDDACIASTIIQLKAHELGLGSCWLQTKGKFDANGKPCHDNIREILEIPEDIYISNLISLGYPAEERPAYTEKDMDMSKVHYNKW